MAFKIYQKWRRGDRACALSLCAVNKQTVEGEIEHNEKKMKMASARKPESFNEVELLLRLTLNYKASKLQKTRTQAVVRQCCCYEMLQGRRLEVVGWGNGVIVLESMQIAVHMKTWGLHFWIFPPWDPVSKKCIFRCCIFKIRVDDRPKQCKTCAFPQKSVSVWMASKTDPLITLKMFCFGGCQKSKPDDRLSTMET